MSLESLRTSRSTDLFVIAPSSIRTATLVPLVRGDLPRSARSPSRIYVTPTTRNLDGVRHAVFFPTLFIAKNTSGRRVLRPLLALLPPPPPPPLPQPLVAGMVVSRVTAGRTPKYPRRRQSSSVELTDGTPALYSRLAIIHEATRNQQKHEDKRSAVSIPKPVSAPIIVTYCFRPTGQTNFSPTTRFLSPHPSSPGIIVTAMFDGDVN